MIALTRRSAFPLTLAFATLLTVPASAQPGGAQQAMQGGGMTGARQLDDARAREHFMIATRYYEDGRFQEAAAQFTEAYELSARGELLYNAYIAHREAGDSVHAAASLESYLSQVRNAPDRANLQARLGELRNAIAEDSALAAALEAARGEAEAATARAEAEARARREAEGAGEAWPWVILSIGAAAAIAGGVLGGLALSDASALRAECDTTGLCNISRADLDERRGDIQLFANVSDALLIGGGTVAVLGLVLGLVFGLPSGGDEAEEGEPQAELACDLTGCRGTVRGSF